MYRQGKWIISLRNKYGYKSVFQKRVFKSKMGPYDHVEMIKLDIMQGNYTTEFDPQVIELHFTRKKITPKYRFGINHPVYFSSYYNDYILLNKDVNPNDFNDEICGILFFLCIQELSTRVFNYEKYKHKDYAHLKAIVKTLFILRKIIQELKKRHIYY